MIVKQTVVVCVLIRFWDHSRENTIKKNQWILIFHAISIQIMIDYVSDDMNEQEDHAPFWFLVLLIFNEICLWSYWLIILFPSTEEW